MKLRRSEAIGLVIDVQERLHPHMASAGAVADRISVLLEGLAALEVPVLATEQYPRGLGSTIQSTKNALGAAPIVEKIEFSCAANPGFMDRLRESGKGQVIVSGIEAHVCVLQTSVDLVEAGYDVIVAVDCTSSRNEADAAIAYRRMESEGVRLGTSESILLELCRVAGTETFKTVSKLIK